MNVRGERIIIFGDSLSHGGADSGPTIQDITTNSARQSSAPGDLLASMLLEQGAAAVRTNAKVGRSAWNFWQREPTASLIASDQAFKPTKVVVMLGTNDADSGVAPDKDFSSFVAIRDIYRSMGAEVIAIGPFLSAIPAQQVEQVVQTMKSAFGSLHFIDGRPLSQLAVHARDGVHYTVVGARTLALALTDAILSKLSPATLWNSIGLGVLGIGVVFLGAVAYSRHQRKTRGFLMDSLGDSLDDSFTAESSTMLGDTVDIVDGKRFRGPINALVRKGYEQIPCSSGLDKSGLARCWAKPIAALGEVAGIGAEDLPRNPDGTVTLYHHTSRDRANQIVREKTLKSAGEPDVYFTTEKSATTGYGDTVVAIDVDPDLLVLDDEFPSGRQDFRISTPKKALRLKRAQLAGLASADDQRYRIAYALTTRRDGEIVSVRDVVPLNRPMTLAEAEKMRRKLKNQYNAPWIETVDGEFVPVKGAMKPHKFVIGDKREGETFAMTLPEQRDPRNDKPRRADDYVKDDSELEGPEDEVIAYAITDSASRAPKFGGRKVMISDVYEQLKLDGRDDGMSLDEFKQELVRLHKAGNIELTRADLVAAMDPSKVRASETDARGATFHFVTLSGARSHNTRPQELDGHDDSDEDEPAPRETTQEWLARLDRQRAERMRPMRDALATHDALILESGRSWNRRRVLVIKSPEVADVDAGSMRITEFDDDGPIGHTTRKTVDELADELTSTWQPASIRPATDEDMAAMMGSERFAEGAARVIATQKANSKLDGPPITVYHGTRNPSAILKNGFIASTGGEFGPGIYFSENPDTARFYAEHVARGSEPPTILQTTVDVDRFHTVRKTDWIKRTEKRTPRTVQNALKRKGERGIIGIAINDHERQIVAFDPSVIVGPIQKFEGDGLGGSRFRIADLPRDMREELFNLHASGVNPRAVQKAFEARSVPSRTVDITSYDVSSYTPEATASYTGKLPPIVVANGKLVDGGHRVAEAQRRGMRELVAIDMTGLIDPESTGFVA